MTSINLFPTFQYSQPGEYHFSHDSVFLARRVFEYLRNQGTIPDSILDLCAGCGVIGLDLLYHLRQESDSLPSLCDFMDVQSAYATHFEENLRRLGLIRTRCRFINENYNQSGASVSDSKYDLIVCNPPYFSKDQGAWPASDLKLRSRFFVDSDLSTLTEFISRKVSPSGEAFVLIRNHTDHGKNQRTVLESLCSEKLNVVWMEPIRGTDLAHLSLNLNP